MHTGRRQRDVFLPLVSSPFSLGTCSFLMTQEPCNGTAEERTVIHPPAVLANIFLQQSVCPCIEMLLYFKLRTLPEGIAAYQCQRSPLRREAAGATEPLVEHTHCYLRSWHSFKHTLHFPAALLQTVSPRHNARGGGGHCSHGPACAVITFCQHVGLSAVKLKIPLEPLW